MMASIAAGARTRFWRTIVLCVALAAVVPFCWSSVRAFSVAGKATPITDPADFRAFYCAARMLDRGVDPYRTEPLRSCQQAATRIYGLQMFAGLVLPAPLPPFALALLIPLARLDFRVASPIWLGLSLLAFAAASVLLARLTRRPVAWIACLLAGPVAYVSMPLGQPMPLVVALLCGAALAVRAGRYSLAAPLCALTTVEPHVGLPACVALFAFCGPTRRALLGCAALAALASCWLAPPSLIMEYLTRVIPLHALSQVDAFSVQYSLTGALKAAGATTAQALMAGALSYAGLTVLGVFVAWRLARRFGDAAFLVLVPPAFAVIGGTFVHLAQIAAAVPALLLLGSYLPRRSRAWAFAVGASLALAVPWSSVADAPALATAIWRHPVAPRAMSGPPVSGTSLAEETESAFIKAGGYGSNGGPIQLVTALKIPTWLGLLCFATLACGRATPRGMLRPALRSSLTPHVS